MKKYTKSCLLGVIFLTSNISWAEMTQVVTVTMMDDSSRSVPLYTNPIVTMDSEHLLIENDNDKIDFDIQNVKKMDYRFIDIAGIDKISIESSNYPFRLSDSGIEFDATDQIRNVLLGSPNGIVESVFKIAAYNKFLLPTTYLTKGVHLLNVNGKTYKILIK